MELLCLRSGGYYFYFFDGLLCQKSNLLCPGTEGLGWELGVSDRKNIRTGMKNIISDKVNNMCRNVCERIFSDEF